MNRRRYLAALAGLAGASGLAGCLGGPAAGTPTNSPEPTASGEHPVTPTDTSFEVLTRDCGAGRNRATVGFDGAVVSVDGVIGGRDTCDTARLAEVALRDDELTVTVEVVPEPTTGTVACGQCLTDIEYAFRTTVATDAPGRVTVVHRTADGRTTVATADRP